MPATRRRTELHRDDPTTGRWLSVVADVDALGAGRLRIEVGSTGNRIDPERRVRRRGHDLVRIGGRLELRSWWPVQEVRTHVVGQFADDLRGELAAAGSPDVDDDLAEIGRIAGSLFGDDDVDDLATLVLRSAYPLLRRPVEMGARPPAVPVPLEPLLHHDEPRAAARATLGPRVTRPLVRALAGSLVPDDDGTIAWEPLLLARLAADRCGPEQLAAILGTRPHRRGAVSISLTDIDRGRAMFEDTQPRRIAEELVESLRTEGGTTALVQRIVRHDARPPAPPVPPAPPPRPRRAAPQPQPQPQVVADPCDQPIQYPAAWRAVEGTTVPHTTLSVVLPRTGNELLEWGLVMDNCLGAYRVPAANGRTRMMGFADGDRLQCVAEVSATRTLRQLEAPGNRVPRPARSAAILAFLREQRLIETDARRAV